MGMHVLILMYGNGLAHMSKEEMEWKNKVKEEHIGLVIHEHM